MSREKAVKICCDRCNRTEIQPMLPDKTTPDFEISLLDQHLVYEDLCVRCRDKIKNIWPLISEWEKEVKWTVLKNGPLVSSDQAAPLQPAPEYSPPQPFSAASVKR